MSYASVGDLNNMDGHVDYNGILNDIIKLDFFQTFKVVLFKCDWTEINNSRGIKKDKYGFTSVNFYKLIIIGEYISDEPYVFSSQVKHVFYCKDPLEDG